MSAVSRIAFALVFALAGAGFAPASPAQALTDPPVAADEITVDVAGELVVNLPIVASHVTLNWPAAAEPELSIAFSADGSSYGASMHVAHDHFEVGGDQRGHSGVIVAGGARFARITAEQPLAGLTIVAMAAGTRSATAFDGPRTTAELVEQPQIISRAEWGANESWRFDDTGAEIWPPEFFPVQKLIIHHTAGVNNDPDPAATVRAIHYYNAITRGWSDIGYNFLIDEQGRIYEGRYSRPYEPGEVPTGEDAAGNGVVGAHVASHNAGTVGIVLLGHLVEQDATPAARAALEWLLAWKAERHAIDPLGGGLYVNPATGLQRENPNISGHGDWAATKCPGGTFHATLPQLRQRVAAIVAGEPVDEPPAITVPAAAQLTAVTAPKRRGVRLRWSLPPDGGSPLTRFRVLRLKKGRFVRVATLTASATTWRDRNTRSGRTYTYVIRAVNGAGVGPFSNRASAVAR